MASSAAVTGSTNRTLANPPDGGRRRSTINPTHIEASTQTGPAWNRSGRCRNAAATCACARAQSSA